MTRVALIGGCRTPFVKAGGVFAHLRFLDLATHVVKSLVASLALKSDQIDELIYSTVLLDPRYPNFAREIVFRSGLAPQLSAHSVSNNCISGLVAASVLREGILSGRLRSGLAGGSESMSSPTLTLRPQAEKFFLGLARARSLGDRLKILSKLRPKYLLPIPPSPKEPSTGLTMGEHCELMAKEFKITRERQDVIAFQSHQSAAQAQSKGYLGQEIAPVGNVDKDNLIRADTSLEKLKKLSPVFDRSGTGSLTAGNSSALTDGASVVCLMSEAEARQQGRKPLAFIDGIEFASVAPAQGLLMAPALALPRLLQRHNISLDQIDVFEIHEAFGAQVAANLDAWEQGWNAYPSLVPIGKVPLEKINPNGGSIAIGHPFAATGGRLMLSVANHLERTGQKTGVISVCAAGGMACAMLMRRE